MSNFTSKIGIFDGTPEGRGSAPLTGENLELVLQAPIRQLTLKKIGDRYFNNAVFNQWGASGLAAVWAEENTRESIYSALRRKEAFATTGPRIKVRFFAGYDFNKEMINILAF